MTNVSKIAVLLILAAAAAAPAAWAQTSGADAAPELQSGAGEVVPDAGYRIAAEDILGITVWKEEGLQKEVVVRPDGGVSFPLVGEIHAAGRTADQLRAEITERLLKSINDPVVTVSVLKVAGYKIYVIGRVNKPGEFVTGRYVDVLQALSMAGGLTPYAAENDIKVLRKRDGKEVVLEFRYSDIRRGRKLDQNITLQGGDVVLVP